MRGAGERVHRNHTDRYQWEKDRARLPLAERQATGASEHDTGLDMSELAFNVQYHVIDASPSLASGLAVPVGTRLLQRDYRTITRKDDVPLNVVHSYLVYDMAAKNRDLLDEANEPWPGGTQHQLCTLGIELDRIVDEVSARPPLPEEAQDLDIDPGVAVLVLHKTSIDINNHVVEYSEVVMPGDRTDIVHTTRLARWSQ